MSITPTTKDKLEEAERLIEILWQPVERISDRWDSYDIPDEHVSDEHKLLKVAYQAYIQWESDYEQ